MQPLDRVNGLLPNFVLGINSGRPQVIFLKRCNLGNEEMLWAWEFLFPVRWGRDASGAPWIIAQSSLGRTPHLYDYALHHVEKTKRIETKLKRRWGTANRISIRWLVLANDARQTHELCLSRYNTSNLFVLALCNMIPSNTSWNRRT